MWAIIYHSNSQNHKLMIHMVTFLKSRDTKAPYWEGGWKQHLVFLVPFLFSSSFWWNGPFQKVFLDHPISSPVSPLLFISVLYFLPSTYSTICHCSIYLLKCILSLTSHELYEVRNQVVWFTLLSPEPGRIRVSKLLVEFNIDEFRMLQNLVFLNDLKIRNNKRGSLRTAYLWVLPFSGKQKTEHYEPAEGPSTTAMCSQVGDNSLLGLCRIHVNEPIVNVAG